jgi:hypothetical protein
MVHVSKLRLLFGCSQAGWNFFCARCWSKSCDAYVHIWYFSFFRRSSLDDYETWKLVAGECELFCIELPTKELKSASTKSRSLYSLTWSRYSWSCFELEDSLRKRLSLYLVLSQLNPLHPYINFHILDSINLPYKLIFTNWYISFRLFYYITECISYLFSECYMFRQSSFYFYSFYYDILIAVFDVILQGFESVSLS